MAAGLGIGLIQPLGIFIVTEQLGLSKREFTMVTNSKWCRNDCWRCFSDGICKNVAPQKMLIIGMLGQAIGIGIIGYSTNLWITLTAQLLVG